MTHQDVKHNRITTGEGCTIYDELHTQFLNTIINTNFALLNDSGADPHFPQGLLYTHLQLLYSGFTIKQSTKGISSLHTVSHFLSISYQLAITIDHKINFA